MPILQLIDSVLGGVVVTTLQMSEYERGLLLLSCGYALHLRLEDYKNLIEQYVTVDALLKGR